MALPRDLDLICRDNARATLQHRDADIRKEPRINLVEAADLGCAIGLQRCPVEARRRARPAEAMRLLEALGVVRSEAVELLRDATEVDARAAEGSVFGHRHAQAALCGHACGAHAAAAGADDEKIEGVVAHGVALFSPFSLFAAAFDGEPASACCSSSMTTALSPPSCAAPRSRKVAARSPGNLQANGTKPAAASMRRCSRRSTDRTRPLRETARNARAFHAPVDLHRQLLVEIGLLHAHAALPFVAEPGLSRACGTVGGWH